MVRTALAAMIVTLGACGQRPAAPPPAEPPVEVTVSSRPIGDAELARIRQRPEVVSVIPRMSLNGPALGTLRFEGQDIRVEVGGFADGIPADAIEPGLADRFVDGAEPVPVVVSPTMIELYNDRVADAHGLPHLGEADIAAAGERLTFTIELGTTMGTLDREWPHGTVTARVIGVSRRAKRVGLTAPIGRVAAWNRVLLGDGTPASYHAVVVVLRGASARPGFAAWLERELGLTLDG